MSLEAHLRELLSSDATLAGLLSCDASKYNSRIGFGEFEGAVVFPALLITLVSTTRSHHLKGPDGWAFPHIQIDCYAKTYKAVLELATAVRKILDGYTGTREGTYIGSSIMDNERDFPEPDEPTVKRRIVEFQMIFEDS